MTDIQAAIGLIQLEKVDAMLCQRASLARRYDAALAEMDDLEPPYVPGYATHAYSSYAVRLRPGSPVDSDTLVRRMAGAGVSCRVGIQPLHWEPIYRERWGLLSLPETEAAARTVFFLPIFPGMTEDQQSRVVETLRRSLYE
jgi:perosamine synthetase